MDRAIGERRRTAERMTTGISALTALLALAGPDKGRRVGIPAPSGGFEPRDKWQGSAGEEPSNARRLRMRWTDLSVCAVSRYTCLVVSSTTIP